ncbi:Cleavage induced protein [Phytophthora megakarya]|uniref:Cleavage induced protein n=1 Tax=Phytophthora megakarya TaxID=4795 RepID=A0A225W5N2_9STRA|nr:Cleavage induced protein [Phytophthora megakarya]
MKKILSRGSVGELLLALNRTFTSAPSLKIDKDRECMRTLCAQPRATRTELNKVIGFLYHIATCVRSAAPFFQGPAAVQRQAPHCGNVPLSDGIRDDLRWFLADLAADELNTIPLSRFMHSRLPVMELNMNASIERLCALYPARREYLQVRFDAKELSSIEDLKAGRPSSLDINT